MREANNSANESLEASLEVFDMSLNILQLNHDNFIDSNVKATIQVLSDIGLFDRFENEYEIFVVYISFNKRRREEVGFAIDSRSELVHLDKWECH